MSVNVTTKDFESTINSDELVLVDFWAVWCGPCKMLTPTLEKLEQELEGAVKVAKVNVDEESDLARDYGIMSIPTMILFENGTPVKTIVGVKPKAALLEEIKDYL